MPITIGDLQRKLTKLRRIRRAFRGIQAKYQRHFMKI